MCYRLSYRYCYCKWNFKLYSFYSRAHRESGNFRDAVLDLNEALKISPQNRDLYRMILRVKDEMSKSPFGSNNNNDDQSVGSSLNDKLKYVDDSSSEVTSSSLKNL